MIQTTEMRVVGRICARGDGVVGVYRPMNASSLNGVYEVREEDGRLFVVRIGEAQVDPEEFLARSLDDLVNQGGKFFLVKGEDGRDEKIQESMTPVMPRHRAYDELMRQVYAAIDAGDEEEAKKLIGRIFTILGSSPEVIRAEGFLRDMIDSAD